MSLSRSTKIKVSIDLPQIRLPASPRNPEGWSKTLLGLRGRGFPGAASLRNIEPAGEPPRSWAGTRPEWAVQWGLLQNGLEDGEDFTFQARLPGVGSSYYSTVDFLIRDFNIAIEVQGKFWHEGQGSAKIFNDLFRVAAYAGQGIKVIFIDEPDALADPAYFVKEALMGVDHSHVVSGRRN